MKLSSGAMTGTFCQCKRPVWSYYEAAYQRGVPLESLSWTWVFVCEAGHWQAEQAPEPVQMSLLDEVTQ